MNYQPRWLFTTGYTEDINNDLEHFFKSTGQALLTLALGTDAFNGIGFVEQFDEVLSHALQLYSLCHGTSVVVRSQRGRS